jgi:two-component system KDP operon response regulator KdpE
MSNAPHILVIDDEPQILRAIRTILTEKQFRRVYMRQLRKKLEADPERPQYILTKPGIGYRFMADE